MKGLGATDIATGEGIIKWNFRDEYGVEQTVAVKALLVPSSQVRLFSPQSFFKQGQGETFLMNVNGTIFTFPNGSTLSFKYSSNTKL